MAKKTKKHSAGTDGASSSVAADAGGMPWLRLMAIVVLTAHSALSAYLARDDARLMALVTMGYLLMLALFFYGLPVLQKRD
jgi:hypothetical protein